MSYPVPTGKNDDFSPWSPSFKKVFKRGLMERGKIRAATSDYRTLILEGAWQDHQCRRVSRVKLDSPHALHKS